VNDEKIINQDRWSSAGEFNPEFFEFEMGVTVIFPLNYTDCTLNKNDRRKESGRKKPWLISLYFTDNSSGGTEENY
jgi:hypothetical protein